MKLILTVVVLLKLYLSSLGQDVSSAYEDEEISISNETLFSNSKSLTDISTFTSVSFDNFTNEDDHVIEYSDKKFQENFGDCDGPPKIDHTIIKNDEGHPYNIGTTLSYSCEFGYSTDGGSHTTVCVESTAGGKASWTKSNIICIPQSCGDPGFVVNGYRIGSLFTFPNSISFECDTGYILRGFNTRYCQVSGKWSGKLPSCERIYCDHPKDPENGRAIYSSREYGSLLKYECENGFALRKYEPRECDENGTWSGSEPFCKEAACEVPVAPDHGTVEIVGGLAKTGSIALFTCEKDLILVGSSTSKCLDTGEWIFPTPKCVEPCAVPIVEHGEIGTWTNEYRRRNIFKKLSSQTLLEENAELILRCDQKFEPLGRDVAEVKVTCNQGVWNEIPVCIPAQCRRSPPVTVHGETSRIDPNNGGHVVYRCNSYAKKTKYGNITCVYGEWKGNTPICRDTRCYLNKLRFPGLIANENTVYLNKESFQPKCEKGYVPGNPGNNLTCYEGAWKGHLPPCTPASCLSAPPPLTNGKIKSYSESHSSKVEYECNDGYFMQSASQVVCLFGEWKHNLPICKISGCYFESLQWKKGLLKPLKDPTSNGEQLTVQCDVGYMETNIIPHCAKGKWIEYGVSPCKENNCLISKISNGDITYRKSTRYWTIYGYRTDIQYYKEQIGKIYNPGGQAYVNCDGGYTFQGKNRQDVQITCSEGVWKPHPICLPYGQIYREPTKSAARHSLDASSRDAPKFELSTKINLDSSSRVAPKNEPSKIFPSSTNGITSTASAIIEVTEEISRDCPSCLYIGPNNLVAYSENKLLNFGDEIKLNSTVKFHCLSFGYDRLVGNSEMVCKNCKRWHLSEYPQCVAPKSEDTILRFDWDIFKLLPGGILEVDQRMNIDILCIGGGIQSYPVWESDVNSNLWTAYEAYNHPEAPERYSTLLSIINTEPQHSGKYQCGYNGYTPNTFTLQVKTQCIEIEEDDDMIAHYDNKQNVNSSALFTCRDRNKKVEGPNIITCLSNGKWSEEPPKCVPKGCPELEFSDGLTVIYSQELNIGSTATFHCRAPRIKNGRSQIICLKAGLWSGNPPSCTMSRCPIGDIFEHIQESVVPDMEKVKNDTVPYGFELPLTCEHNLVLEEPATAKCGNNGLWEVPTAKCISGCKSFQLPPDSQLIIEPEKEFYRFGELVSLSCGTGQFLSKEVEVLMCLKNGWSEEELPTCVDA